MSKYDIEGWDAVAVLTADMHLTNKAPLCRTDDYVSAMKAKLKQIKECASYNKLPWFDAGDVFDSFNAPAECISWLLKDVSYGFVSIPGNHDLKNHNMDLFEKSALNVAGAVWGTILTGEGDYYWLRSAIRGIPYGMYVKEIATAPFEYSDRINIVLFHALVFEKEIPYGVADAYLADDIFNMFPTADVIVTGHNHQHFIVEQEDTGRILVNPGSLMRSRADQKDYVPGICILYKNKTARKFKVVKHPFEVDKDAVSIAHIQSAQEKDERMTSFVNSLSMNTELSLSFENNLTNLMSENKVDEKVKELAFNILEESK